MRHSTEPKFRKYVKGYDFLSFARKFGDKYGKKINGYCNENRDRCSKNCFKKSSSKNCRSYRFDWEKIADKITPLGKTKSKEKEEERQEIYISPEKR